MPDLYYKHGNQHLSFHEISWTLFPYYSMGRFQYIYLSLEKKHILQGRGRNSYIYQMEIPPFAFQAPFENNHGKKRDILLQNPNSKVFLQMLWREDKTRNCDILTGIMVTMIYTWLDLQMTSLSFPTALWQLVIPGPTYKATTYKASIWICSSLILPWLCKCSQGLPYLSSIETKLKC